MKIILLFLITVNLFANIDNRKILIKSVKCNGLTIQLMGNSEEYINSELENYILNLSNGKSIELSTLSDVELNSDIRCLKVYGKNQIVIPSTAGNSWSGSVILDIDTLKHITVDYQEEINLGIVEKPVIEYFKIEIANKFYNVPRYPFYFIEDEKFYNSFRTLLNDDFEIFKDNLGVAAHIVKDAIYYVGEGNASHSGGMNESIFTINRLSGDISVAILYSEYKNNSWLTSIKYFGEKSEPIIKWTENLKTRVIFPLVE